MRSYTNAASGKVDSVGSALAVTNSIRNSAVVTNSAPQVICEWKMNSIIKCRGVNDLSGGDDFFSSLYNHDERKIASQDKKFAESFALPWREMNNISTVKAVSNDTYAPKVYNDPWNGTRTKFYPASDTDGLRTWTSPKPSVAVSVASLTSKANTENSAKSIEVKDPTGPNGSHNRIATGVHLDGSGNGWLLFPMPLPSKPTGKKDKFDWYMPGNKVDLMANVALRTTSISYAFSGFLPRTILGVQQNRPVTVYNIEPGKVRILNNTTNRVTYFNADYYGLFFKGQTISVGSWSSKISEVPVPVKIDGTSYVKVTVASPFPWSYMRGGGGQAMIIRFPAAVKVSLGAWSVGFTNYAVGFVKPVGVTPIVVSKVTNSTQLQGELDNLAKLGGASVQYTKNIVWTTKTRCVNIPSGMTLNFTGATLTGTGLGGTYMISAGSVNHRVKSGKTNITIIGGTWNVGGSTGSAVGAMRILGVSGMKVAFATINNFSNAPGILMQGCMDTRIVGCNISTSVNHSTNHNNSAAIALNSYESNTEYNACSNIQIDNNTLASKYGVRSAILSTGLIGSHKNIKINNNTITGDIAGVELSDYDQYAIMYNTLTVASGMNGINIFSSRTSSTYGYIYSNSILGASPSKHIYLTGTSSDVMVGKIMCIYNVTNGTGGNTNGGPTTMIISTDYAAVVFIEAKSGQATTINTTAHSALVSSSSPGQTINQIRYVQPKIQYYVDKSEVTQIRQLGQKLEVWLSEPLETAVIGGYINFDGIHPAVDGDKKVLQITHDGDGFARRTKLVLASKLSQTICRKGTSNKAVPAPWPLEQKDDTGYAHVVKDIQANKITVKFDVAYGTPKDGVVQTKHNGVWSTVYTFDTSVTALSNELERDSEYPATNNIRALTIYRNSGGTWSTTESNFDPVSNRNTAPIDAVRVVVSTTISPDQYVSVTEISARLSADVTSYTKSFSVDKELGDPNDLAPVGTASTNTGTVSFINPTGLFTHENVSGPFFGLFVKNAIFHIYMNYTSGSVYKTKIATMMSDTWKSTGRDAADVSLVDKSIVLQTIKCRDFVAYNNENNTALPMKRALQSLLDSVGFSNYLFNGLNDFGTLEFIWSKKELTPWEILKEIALCHQMSIYFDEIGRLQIMSRGYIYPEQKEIVCSASAAGQTITAEYASDLNGIVAGTPVYWAGGAFASKIDSGAIVYAVNKDTRTITLTASKVNGAFTQQKIGFGRAVNYGVIGSNIDNDRIIDRLQLKPVRRTRTWTVSSNEVLPTTVGISADTLEKKPLCSIIRQQPEFYVNNYQSTAGNAVTLSVYASEDDNVSIPNTGSQVYVKNVGTGFDGIYTLTGRSAFGAAWLLNYTGTAGARTVSSDAAGVVGWTTTEAGYLIKGLEVGKKYKFDGMIYIPSTNTAGYAVTPGTDASVSTGGVAITTRNAWVSFAIDFTADNIEHTVKYSIVNGTSDDLLYIYDEEAYYNDTSISEGGYDEVSSGETAKIDRANKVVVTYKPLNRYGSENGVLASQKATSAKALLFNEDGNKILDTFEFLGFSNGRFLFNPQSMNAAAKIEPIADNKTTGTAEKPKNSSGWWPLKGTFDYNGKKYKYEGLYAKPAELGKNAKEILVKDDLSLAYVTELNHGVPPTYTGQGELKKSYSMELWNFNDPYDATKTAYVVPKNLTLKPLLQGKEIPADLTGGALVWTTKLKKAQQFGAEFSITTLEFSKLSKLKTISLHVFQDLSEGYDIGLLFNEKGQFTAYATASYTETPKAAPGTKVHPKTTVRGLKVLSKTNVSGITRDALLASPQRLEVVTWDLTKTERCFDLYLGQHRLARFLDDTDSVAKIAPKASMWVRTGPGAGVVVRSTYAIENKNATKRDQEWYDPGKHGGEVDAEMWKWAAQIAAAVKKQYPKATKAFQAKKTAEAFERRKKAMGSRWSDTQTLTQYLNQANNLGAKIDRKIHDLKE